MSLLTTHPKLKVLSCPHNSTHISTRVAENPEKLNDEIINGRLLAMPASHREIHGAQEGIGVIVLSGSGVRRDENFIVNVWLGKIGSAKEGLGILVFNSYIVGEQIVGGPVATRLGGTDEIGHPTAADERKTVFVTKWHSRLLGVGVRWEARWYSQEPGQVKATEHGCGLATSRSREVVRRE